MRLVEMPMICMSCENVYKLCFGLIFLHNCRLNMKLQLIFNSSAMLFTT